MEGEEDAKKRQADEETQKEAGNARSSKEAKEKGGGEGQAPTKDRVRTRATVWWQPVVSPEVPRLTLRSCTPHAKPDFKTKCNVNTLSNPVALAHITDVAVRKGLATACPVHPFSSARLRTD